MIYVRRHPVGVAMSARPEFVGSLVLVAFDQEVLANAGNTGPDVALRFQGFEGYGHIEVVVWGGAVELWFPAMVGALGKGVVLEVERQRLGFGTTWCDDETLNVAGGEDLREAGAIHAWLSDPDFINAVALGGRPGQDGFVKTFKVGVVKPLPLGPKRGEKADDGDFVIGPAATDVAHVGGGVGVLLVA